MDLNSKQNCSDFVCSKQDLPEVEKFEIKYNSYSFEEMTNFIHRNFFRFKLDFE
jgi:hypothetical protein